MILHMSLIKEIHMKYGSKDTERDWQNFWWFWAIVWALLHPPPSSTPDEQTDE